MRGKDHGGSGNGPSLARSGAGVQRLAVALLALLLPGCTLGTADQALRSGWYFGLVRLERPPQAGAVQVLDLRWFGITVHEVVAVGAGAISTVSVPDGACSLTLIARDDADLRHAMSLIESLKGEPCTVDLAQHSR